MVTAADLRPGTWALDVGCGNGALVAIAAPLGRLAGMDVSTPIVRAARERTRLGTFLVGSASSVPVRANMLDRLFSQHLIEHVSDPPRAVAEWFRCLRPGGRIVIITPNRRYPDPSVFDDPTHVLIYNGVALRALLVHAGFRNVRTRTVFPYLRGHIAFGLRHRRLFSRVPPWSATGRSLMAVGEKPRTNSRAP